MPLSEEELRLLEQMERALQEEDPKFASTLRGHSLFQSAKRRLVLSIAAFVVGLGLLMTGAISAVWVVGVIGFVVMLAAVTLGLSARRDLPAGESGSTAFRNPTAQRASRSGSFMARLEARWERRRGGAGW